MIIFAALCFVIAAVIALALIARALKPRRTVFDDLDEMADRGGML
jgi:hypothetical protein